MLTLTTSNIAPAPNSLTNNKIPTIAATYDGARARELFDSLNEWTRIYNEDIRNGKWGGFFNWRPYHTYWSETLDVPYFTSEMAADALTDGDMGVKHGFIPVSEALSSQGAVITCREDCEVPLWIEAVSPVRNFSKAPEENVFCHVDMGNDSFDASATPINNVWHSPFIGPMWSKVGILHLKKGDNILMINNMREGSRIDRIYSGIWPPFDIPSYTDPISEAPYVEYEIGLCESDTELEVRTLPTLHVHEGRDARYAVQIGSEEPQVFSIHAGDFTAEWRLNVLRGYSSRAFTLPSDLSGPQKIRVYFLDPGIVLQEIIVR